MTLKDPSDDEISLTSTVESDQHSEYEVETILAEHEFPDGTRFLVQWTGYPIERCTWEPADAFSADQTLLDWEQKKRDIAEGKQVAFDVSAWENRLVQFEEDRKERKRRRAAKRRKIALSELSSNIKSVKHAPGSQGASNPAVSRPPNARDKPSSLAHVHPSRHGQITVRQPPPVLFGRSNSVPDPVRLKKGSSTDTPRIFNLSTKRKYEKAKNYEPPPNINQLDLRRPSDWTSVSSTQLGSSRLGSLRTDAAANSQSDSPVDVHGSSPVFQVSPVHSPGSTDTSLSNSRPRRPHAEVNSPREGSGLQNNHKVSNGGCSPKFPPRRPGPRHKRVTGMPDRFCNEGEVFVSMYFGPQRHPIGHARLCGLESSARKKIFQSKKGGKGWKINVWFRFLCTLHEYNALCDRMSNEKYCNGWIEGFDDTEPEIYKAAESLRQQDLVAIAYIENDKTDVLLAYPPQCHNFKFLDNDSGGPEQGYLNIALRSTLGPVPQKLSLMAINSHSKVTVDVNDPPESGHMKTKEVNGSSYGSEGDYFDVAPSSTTNSLTGSPLFIRDSTVAVPSLVQSTLSIRTSTPTDNSAESEKKPPSSHATDTEDIDIPMDIDPPSDPATLMAPVHADANQPIDLDEVFRKNFCITFQRLAAPNGTDKAGRVEMFYLWFPEDSEVARNERDVITAFLKKHTSLVYSNRVAEDWERFVTMCNKNILGVVLFHESFRDYHTVHFFRELLRRATGFWNVSISRPLQCVDRTLYFQRLFPHGGIILLTEDFMVREPDATLIILDWFYEWAKKKYPGSWKMMFRPDVLNWILSQLDVSVKSKPKWLAMYHLLTQLSSSNDNEILSGVEDDSKGLVISPPCLCKYGSRTADDCPEVPRDATQEYRNTDHLAEFFAGWCLVNSHRYRRFTILTALEPLPRWANWQHVEVRRGARDFISGNKIDYRKIWAKLTKGMPKSTSSTTGQEEELPSYTPQTPKAPSDPRNTVTSEKRSVSFSLPPKPPKPLYPQPYN